MSDVLLNERQRWFLAQLATGANPRASNIVQQFRVAVPTAKRDISAMKQHGLIHFQGGTKTGTYALSDSQPGSAHALDDPANDPANDRINDGTGDHDE